MKLLNTNELKCVAGGLEGNLTAEFYYSIPYTYNYNEPSPVHVSYEMTITGPADDILFKIKSQDYPHFVEGYEELKISSIYIRNV
ncbi:MAG: hypothetical protein AB7V32_05270 [Candidatus Berkiella sp.]